jgi:hypothetical protein
MTDNENVVSFDGAKRLLAKAKKLEPEVTQDGVVRLFPERHANELRFELDYSIGCWEALRKHADGRVIRVLVNAFFSSR